MSFDLEKILASKRALRRDLAARPIAEKLRMLDALRERALALRAAAPGPPETDALRELRCPTARNPNDFSPNSLPKSATRAAKSSAPARCSPIRRSRNTKGAAARDFALLFLLCFPHRLSQSLVKHFEEKMHFLREPQDARAARISAVQNPGSLLERQLNLRQVVSSGCP